MWHSWRDIFLNDKLEPARMHNSTRVDDEGRKTGGRYRSVCYVAAGLS